MDTVKAVIMNDKIICGKCGHKIAEKKGVLHALGRGEIYIICKHRDKGKNCNTINKIEL